MKERERESEAKGDAAHTGSFSIRSSSPNWRASMEEGTRQNCGEVFPLNDKPQPQAMGGGRETEIERRQRTHWR